LAEGVMVVGHNRFQGRDKIRAFYTWRERQATTAISSVKTTRHVINNLLVESSDPRRAKLLGIVSFYGAAVRAPGPQSKPPMLIADLIAECVLGEDHGWQFQSHMLQPVFMSHEAPPSIAIDARRQAAGRIHLRIGCDRHDGISAPRRRFASYRAPG